MSDELMPFDLPEESTSIIKVIGVGGGGCNAVNHMYRQGIKDVNFIVTNTDSQALENSPVPLKLQLGSDLTGGRGAGNKPDKGKQAAIENLDDIVKVLSDETKMVFITAGMGGGTGTGAAPVIAKATKDMGILTVGIVTIPFRFEGQRRIKQAVEGITELSNHVDSLLAINNEKLREIYGDSSISEAFAQADNVLTMAAKGIAEIITVHGHVNVDFADVQTVMTDSGVALMGSGQASGENRAIKAIEDALSSPLLNSNDINGAQNILLNITSGSKEASMDEIGQINEYAQEAAGFNADLIWGNTIDEELGDKIAVTIIATGFKTDILPELEAVKPKKKTVVHLEEKTRSIDNKNKLFVLDDQNNEATAENQKRKHDEMNANFDTNTPLDFNDNDPFEDLEEIDFDEINKASGDKANERFNNFKESKKDKKSIYKKNDYFENIEKYENEPAYKRKNIDLDDYNVNEKSKVSKYTLYVDDEDDGPVLKANNSYLHDKVD